MFKFFNKLFSIYIVLWVFVPFVQIGAIYRLLVVFCSFSFLFNIFVKDISFIVKHKNLLSFMLVNIVLLILTKMFLLEPFDAFIDTLQYIITIFVCFISLYYLDRDKKFLLQLVNIVLFVLIIFNISTIKGLIENPYVARIANSEWLHDRFEDNKYFGTYGYIYMCVFIELMLFYIKKNKIKINILFDSFTWINLFLIIVLVLLSGYSIANICLFIEVVVIFLMKENRGVINYFICMILISLFFFFQNIFNFFYDNIVGIVSNNEVYRLKLEEFNLAVNNNVVTGDALDRQKNYMASFKKILDYPIIGSYFFGKDKGGGHSFILDYFGRYGLIVSAMSYYLIFVIPHKIIKYEKLNLLNYMLIIISLFFLLLNPFSQELSIALFLFFPFFQFILKKENIKELL